MTIIYLTITADDARFYFRAMQDQLLENSSVATPGWWKSMGKLIDAVGEDEEDQCQNS